MLQVQELRKTYDGNVIALSGVTLTAQTGLYALLGPNGAGKSSLMRTIATLQAADSGSVTLDGRDNTDTLKWKRQLGYMPQDFGVYDGVTALVLLAHFAALKGIEGRKAQKEAAEKLLVQVNLWEQRHRNVHSFSGGMLRRFILAQALLGAPRLILVDEPTAGLDPEERNRILALLSEASRSAVVILSTHLIGDVADMCDRMGVLVRGALQLECTPDEALELVKNRVWERVVSPADVSRWTLRQVVLSHRSVRGQVVLRVFGATAPDSNCSAVPATLEDAYFLTLRRADLDKKHVA